MTKIRCGTTSAGMFPCTKRVIIAKRNELHKFAVIPKRWIVERTFGWLENYRRLWKNCERTLANTVQMTVLAFISLLLRRW
jgi:transposase